LVGPERLSVCLGGVLTIGAAVADYRTDADEGRAPGFRASFLDRSGQRTEIVGVFNRQRVPSVCLEPPAHVLGECDVRMAVDSDVIVVVDVDDVAESEMARERGGFAGNPLHQISVTDDRKNAMGKNPGILSEARLDMFAGDRHAHPVAETLAERAGCGFHSRRMVVLGMARGKAPQLTEPLYFIERQVVAGKIKQ